MTSDNEPASEQQLHTAEAKLGRALLRYSIAAAWGVCAFLLHTRAEQIQMAPFMRIGLEIFAVIMCAISILHAATARSSHPNKDTQDKDSDPS